MYQGVLRISWGAISLLLIPWPALAASSLSANSLSGQIADSKALWHPTYLSQVDPGQDRFPPASQPLEPLSPEEEALPQPQTAPEPQAAPGSPDDQQCRASKVQVEGSTVFSDEELAQVISPFESRSCLTLVDLREATNAITQLYLNAGYITSRAVLIEPVSPVDGAVSLQVIEGTLQEVRVEGTERLADYIRSRVELEENRPVNQAQLEDRLRLLRSNPLFQTVEASLRAGTEEAASILIVRVAEATPFTANVSIDTLSPRSVGEVRAGALLQYRNLAGWGDTLSAAAYRSTTGGSQVYELSYQVPLNPMEGTLLLRLAPNNFRVTDPNELAFQLGVSGTASVYEAVFRQPLIRTTREELALSLGFRHRNGSTLQGGFVLPPTITSVLSFGQDYLSRDLSGAWALRSQFRLGTSLLGATTAPEPLADGQFFSWLGQVQRVQVLNPDQLLIFQAEVQFSPDDLLGSEQFFVGGAQSVRGYDQNARFGDNGLRLAVEHRSTLARRESGEPWLQVSPFIDLGYVWFNSSTFPTFNQNFLLGTGAGILLTPLPNLETRLDFGIPIVGLSERAGNGSSGLRVYWSINYRI
ncbi:MAG: ShlB/FhaC/HecB family hemolysin secretion/activation protein [Cyanobacteria bacterium Co-bin13]|nr:ShlB/FhaC/HecB family hemolysin secretion/activation protein [Cyanobacteria bacterium Co-bin13]